MNFNRLFVRLLIIVLVLLVAVPAFAQDATKPPITLDAPTLTPPIEITRVPPVEEPVPVEESMSPTQWILAAVIFGLLAFIALVLRPLIVQLGASSPPWAVEAGYKAAMELLKEAQRRAKESPSTLDDTLVEELRKEIDRLKVQIGEAQSQGYLVTIN